VKIVYATDTYLPCLNGVSISICGIKKHLEALGHKVYVLAPDYPGDRIYMESIDGSTIFRFASYPLFFAGPSKDRLAYPWSHRSVHAVLDEIKPDVIHAHTEFSIGHIALKYARNNNIVSVSTHHTYFEEYIQFYIPLFFRWLMSKVISPARFRTISRLSKGETVPSSQMKEVMERLIGLKNLEVLPTGVDFDLFDTKGLTNNRRGHYHDRKDNILELLFVGRIAGEKNIIFLFDVLERLTVSIPGVRLTLVGDGSYREKLHSIAVKRGFKDRVFFTGFVPHEKVVHHYLSADIFVFASKTETQGLTIIEAMHCGLPVVAIEEMGAGEVMAGGKGSIPVPDNVEEFTRAVLMLAQDKDLYSRKSAEGIVHAQNWSMASIADRTIKLYSQLLSGENE